MLNLTRMSLVIIVSILVKAFFSLEGKGSVMYFYGGGDFYRSWINRLFKIKKVKLSLHFICRDITALLDISLLNKYLYATK